MQIIRDYENNLTPEKVLLYVKSRNNEMFLDLADELLEDMKDNDVLHPALAYNWQTVSKIDGDTIWFGEIPFTCSLLSKQMNVGSRACAVMTTVGPQLDAYNASLDDDLDRYFLQGIQQLCLSDAGIMMANTMKSEVSGCHMIMIKPGIEGICEMSEMDHLLAMLPDAADELGVTRRDDGLLMPFYTNVSLFYLTEGEPNLPSEDAADEEIAAFEAALNVAAGHV